jgi:hypothetical protein
MTPSGQDERFFCQNWEIPWICRRRVGPHHHGAPDRSRLDRVFAIAREGLVAGIGLYELPPDLRRSRSKNRDRPRAGMTIAGS